MIVQDKAAPPEKSAAPKLTRLGRPFLTRRERIEMDKLGRELGAMKRRHAGERSALRARQNVERRALLRRVKAAR